MRGKKYYIEFGPKHTRTFISRPSKPLGQIVEIDEASLKTLLKSHPRVWKLQKNTVVAGLALVPVLNDTTRRLACFIVGLILGLLLT